MPNITKNTFKEESHPWGFYIPRGANKLIIGTFPTDLRNQKYNFFYCSSTNRFWKVLSEISAHSYELLSGKNAIEERKKILDKLKLGLTDMGKIVFRQQGSSKDHSLFPIEFIDIIQIMKEYPAITTLIVSGNFQSNSSLSWFSIFCSINKITLNVKELETKKLTTISIADRYAKIILAYSPSSLSRIKTETLINSYSLILS